MKKLHGMMLEIDSGALKSAFMSSYHYGWNQRCNWQLEFVRTLKLCHAI
jgi:hypothetical protein